MKLTFLVLNMVTFAPTFLTSLRLLNVLTTLTLLTICFDGYYRPSISKSMFYDLLEHSFSRLGSQHCQLAGP